MVELTQDLELTLEASAMDQIRTPETRSVEAYELFSRGMMTLRLATRDAPDRAISTSSARWPSTRTTPKPGQGWPRRTRSRACFWG